MPDVNPPHDHDDPQGYLNGLEWTGYLATTVLCPHCHATGKPLPMTGNVWGVELFHEPGCPDHDDNVPTPQRPI